MDTQAHWEKVYREKDPTADVSWFQARPALSLELIAATNLDKSAPLIDVGGGASLLADCLLDAGFVDVSVLDVSTAALDHSRRRLGARAQSVHWIEADITAHEPSRSFHLWHDRAVFHFLTTPEQRERYVSALRRALVPTGHVILATFAKDGPTRCSGLEVCRHDARSICAELGEEFRLLEQRSETHLTPWQSEQQFSWFRFRRNAPTPSNESNSPPRSSGY